MGAKYTHGKNAVGPSKRPPTNDQLAGRLAGVPVLPHDATLVNVALLKFVAVRFAPAKVVLVRLAPAKSVPVRFVPANVVLARFAPVKFVLVRFAPANVALTRLAPVKFVLVRFAPAKFAPVMTEFCKSNVLRFAPVRLAVGPIRYPFFTCQFAGNNAVPITSRAETLVSIAVVKSTLLIST